MRRTRAMTKNEKEHSEDVSRNRKRARTNKVTTSLTAGEPQNSNITSMSKEAPKGVELVQPSKAYIQAKSNDSIRKTAILNNANSRLSNAAFTPTDTPGTLAMGKKALRSVAQAESTQYRTQDDSDEPRRSISPPQSQLVAKIIGALKDIPPLVEPFEQSPPANPSQDNESIVLSAPVREEVEDNDVEARRRYARQYISPYSQVPPPVASRQIQADTMEVPRIISPASAPPSYSQLASHQSNTVPGRRSQRHLKGSLNKLKEQTNSSTRNEAPVALVPPRQSHISPLHQPPPAIPIQSPEIIVPMQSPQTLLAQFNEALLKTASNASKIPARVLPPYVSDYVQAQTSGTMKSISARNQQPTAQVKEPQADGASRTKAISESIRIATPEPEPEIAQIGYSNIDEYRKLLVLYHRATQPIAANDNIEAVEEDIAQAKMSEIDDYKKLRAIRTLENYKREIQPIQEGANIEVAEQRIRVVNLINMPHRALKTIFSQLDPVSSACTGLAAKRLYTYHIEAHGYNVPLYSIVIFTIHVGKRRTEMNQAFFLKELLTNWIGHGYGFCECCKKFHPSGRMNDILCKRCDGTWISA